MMHCQRNIKILGFSIIIIIIGLASAHNNNNNNNCKYMNDLVEVSVTTLETGTLENVAANLVIIKQGTNTVIVVP